MQKIKCCQVLVIFSLCLNLYKKYCILGLHVVYFVILLSTEMLCMWKPVNCLRTLSQVWNQVIFCRVLQKNLRGAW